MSDPQRNEAAEAVSVSHIVHTIRSYAPAIVLATVAVAVAAFIVSLLLYLLAPSQRITTQPFRLDFQGASAGTYPNGLKFSSAEIISQPTLLKVWQDNHIERFMPFNDFARSIFVLEANAEYDKLAADYQARLSDPKLSPVDRERIQREWEAKAAAIRKNDYSINFLRTGKTDRIPESVARKALSDILAAWAQYAIREQHVLSYRLAVISPNIIDDQAHGDLIVDLLILRAKVSRVLSNVGVLRDIPGAELARTPKDKMSLEEIRVRLEEITRYRIEPLVGAVRSNGLIANPAATLRFLESQLAYDRRSLRAQQENTETLRAALAVYSMPGAVQAENGATPATPPKQASAPETVMPQLSDSFIDRLMAITNQAGDVVYRQKMVDDYRKASQSTIPAQQAVAYDEEVISMVRGAPTGGNSETAAQVRTELTATQNEVRTLVGRVNEIYEQVSRNLNPSTELYTLTAPPMGRTERTRNLGRLAAYDLLAVLVALPIIIVICLLHARVREEEEEEGYVAPA